LEQAHTSLDYCIFPTRGLETVLLYAGEENKTASFDVHVGNRNGDFGVKIEGTK
jgi:hypothetical protein